MRSRCLAPFGVGIWLLATAAVATPPAADKTASQAQAVHSLSHRVEQNQATVQHLQSDVSQQEAQSQAAAARLQQQDRAIEQLREQLQALQKQPTPTAAGH